MRRTLSTKTFVVYDDVLVANQHEAVARYATEQTTSLVHVPHYDAVFTIDDGMPRQGPVVVAEIARRGRTLGVASTSTLAHQLHAYPTGLPIDHVLSRVISAAPKLRHLLGPPVERWLAISARLYCYPQGASLSWHDDRKIYAGAFVYYANMIWEPRWGGELLIAERRRRDGEIPEDGRYVAPKPNRLVVLKAGTSHKIARVTKLAGGHERRSIAGFFIRTDHLRQTARER